MTAPSPYDINSTVVIGPWRTPVQSHRAAIAAQIEREERWQLARLSARDDLDALIARKAQKIENLRRQL